MPEVSVGTFDEAALETEVGGVAASSWMEERKRLMEEGAYFQFSSDKTYEDLEAIEKQMTIDEYKKYTPVLPEFLKDKSHAVVDGLGKFQLDMKTSAARRGYYINTFVMEREIDDIGLIDSLKNENNHPTLYDTVYTRFEPSVPVAAGDLFSVYRSMETLTVRSANGRESVTPSRPLSGPSSRSTMFGNARLLIF